MSTAWTEQVMTLAMKSSIEVACEQCRRRKSKCDRARPQCGACLENESPCVFTDQRPKRGPKKGQLRQLKAQVGKQI